LRKLSECGFGVVGIEGERFESDGLEIGWHRPLSPKGTRRNRMRSQ
jgi:hypothetical protein